MVEPFKTKQGKELATTFAKLCEKFKINKSETNIFILDNECSKSVKDTIKSFNATYQLAPPHQHRRNAAENAIKTFKAHLLSGLATYNKDFPIAEWDMLLPQAELTLNLLQNARVNTRLSSWAFLNGNHDFNRHPIAPPGTKIIIHLKPLNRPSWGFHGRMGWYIAPATSHYRCVRCYIPTTRTEVIFDTVKFIPRYIPIPAANIDEHIRQSFNNLLDLLKTKKTIFPKLHTSPDSTTALIELSKILHGKEKYINTNVPNGTNNRTSEGENRITQSVISIDKNKKMQNN